MNSKKHNESNLPFIIGCLVFVVCLSLTQYLAYQQFLISKEKEHETLLHELGNVKDKFRSILYNDITAANTLVILYKEYGTPKNFDQIAQQIIENSKYVDAIQLTKGGVITNVYPVKGRENTIGINSLKDSARQNEAKKAIDKKEIFFAGPRKLREGGIGILGKVPIVVDNDLKGFCVVLTKWKTLKNALGTTNSQNSQFHYVLSKKESTGNNDFKLTDTNPNKQSKLVSINIPEGDWKLEVGYSTNHAPQSFPYELAVFGFFLAAVSGLATFRKLKERNNLQEKVHEKTEQLNKRVDELSTIYEINKLLLNEDLELEEIFNQIIKLLPQGLQFPEICDIKIKFDDKEYFSKNYCQTQNNQIAYFKLIDGRKGFLEVVYTEEKTNPFRLEEHNLINSTTNILEVYLNKVSQKNALKLSEERFRDLVEKSPLGIYILKDWKIVYANPQMIENYGYQDQEIIGQPIVNFVYEEDQDLIRKKIEIRDSGLLDTDRYEIRVKKKDGSYVWNEILSFITTYQGEQALIGTMINMDDKKRLEFEKQQIINDLTQRNLDLEQFSFIVSHNMRAPIANQLGLIELLETDNSIDNQTFILQSIKKSAFVLNDVVTDVNEILSLRKDFLQAKTKINLRVVVEKIETELQNIIHESQAEIICDFSQVDAINSISPYVHSIFLNLISNSMKYINNDINPKIKIWSEKDNDKVTIYIQDNGIGIDLEKYGNQIFGLYKRFDFSKEGKGMGLYMVKAQVNALQGSISVKSEVGKGTTFKISIPIN